MRRNKWSIWIPVTAVALLGCCSFPVHAAETGWTEKGGAYYYINENGKKQTGWKEIHNRWFFFDAETGIMKTGWLSLGKRWYYFDPKTGAMKTGWLSVGKRWFYFDPETGAMKTGWLSVGKRWFYFDPETGAMKTGWQKLRNKWYYFDPETGAMKTGWLEIGNRWYYFNPETGAEHTGWLSYRGNWYYFEPGTGVMKTGWKEWKGKWYFFASTGEMTIGWKDAGGTRYFFKNDGTMAVTEIITIEGKRQGFSGSGAWLGEKSDSFLNAYGKAISYVAKHTDPGMTNVQKLRTCFDLFRTDFKEMNPWIPHYKGMDWVEKYANACLDSNTGNCISYGASLGLMARAIGYDDVYGCNSGGHGWVEIDGKVYDPEWTQHRSGNYFGRPLVRGDSPNYLGSISRTSGSWQYRKI